MHLKHGIFDEAPISVISTATIATIGREAGDGSGRALDARRFRMNIVVNTADQKGFAEDGWIGQTLMFGNPNLSSDAIGAFDQRPAVSVIMPDERCAMVNLDPETGASDARVMKTVVRLNQNNAGVYATVIRTGTVRVGDAVILV
jgi:hypothetical protein